MVEVWVFTETIAMMAWDMEWVTAWATAEDMDEDTMEVMEATAEAITTEVMDMDHIEVDMEAFTMMATAWADMAWVVTAWADMAWADTAWADTAWVVMAWVDMVWAVTATVDIEDMACIEVQDNQLNLLNLKR